MCKILPMAANKGDEGVVNYTSLKFMTKVIPVPVIQWGWGVFSTFGERVGAQFSLATLPLPLAGHVTLPLLLVLQLVQSKII